MTRKDLMARPENERAVIHPRTLYQRRVIPPADILERDNSYTVKMDLPGADKSSINLKIEGDTLRVSANSGDYHGEEPKLLVNEIRPAVYEREFYLGIGVDRNRISAEYENGVLLISIEKAEEAKPREIKIN